MSVSLSNFGLDFEREIRSRGFSLDQLQIEPSGLVLLKNGKTLRPLGCPLCLNAKAEQDEFGEPAIKGEKLTRGVDTGRLPDSTPPEIVANLWLCPKCQLPVVNLLPNFDTGT